MKKTLLSSMLIISITICSLFFITQPTVTNAQEQEIDNLHLTLKEDGTEYEIWIQGIENEKINIIQKTKDGTLVYNYRDKRVYQPAYIPQLERYQWNVIELEVKVEELGDNWDFGGKWIVSDEKIDEWSQIAQTSNEGEIVEEENTKIKFHSINERINTSSYTPQPEAISYNKSIDLVDNSEDTELTLTGVAIIIVFLAGVISAIIVVKNIEE